MALAYTVLTGVSVAGGAGPNASSAAQTTPASGFIALVQVLQSEVVTSVTDNKGNVYTKVFETTNEPGSGSKTAWWACVGAVGGSGHVFTMNGSDVSYATLQPLIVTGYDTTTPWETLPLVTGTGTGTTLTLNQPTLSQAKVLLIFGVLINGTADNPGINVPTGFTPWFLQQNWSYWTGFAALKITTANTALSHTATGTNWASTVGAILGIREAPPVLPVTDPFTQQTASAGGAATFTPGYSSGSAPTSYQWKKNGTPIGGATGASYTTPALTAADNGAFFSVVATNSNGDAVEVGAYAFVRDTNPGIGRGMRSYAYQRHQLGITSPLMHKKSAGDAGARVWGEYFDIAGETTLLATRLIPGTDNAFDGAFDDLGFDSPVLEQTTANVTQVATGTVGASSRVATAAQTTAGVTQTATLAARAGLAATQTADGVTQAATLASRAGATAAQTTDAVAQVATAAARATASATQALAGVSQAATLGQVARAQAIQTLDGCIQFAAAIHATGAATAAQVLDGVSQTATATAPTAAGAVAAQTTAAVTQAATLAARGGATAAQTLAGVTQAATATARATAAAAQTTASVAQATTGAVTLKIPGGGRVDPDFEKVLVLIPGEGTAGSTAIVDVGPGARAVTVNGDAVITGTSVFGGGAVTMSAGSLQVASSTDFDFALEDLTIEMLITPADVTGNKDLYGNYGPTYPDSVCFQQRDDRLHMLASFNGSAWQIDAGSAGGVLAAGVPAFVQLIRRKGVFELRCNGTIVYTNDAWTANALSWTPSAVLFGRQNAGFNPYNGRIEQIRVTKGSARPSIVPTAPYPRAGYSGSGDKLWERVALLLFGDSLNDQSQYGRTATLVGDAVISAGRFTFDGSGGQVRVPYNPVESFDGQDFVAEGKGQFATLAGFQVLFSTRQSDSASLERISAYWNPSLNRFVLAVGTGGGTTQVPAGVQAVTNGVPFEWAVERAGTNVRLYIDGAMVAFVAIGATTALNGGTGAFTIGSTGTDMDATFNGQIWNVRLTIGAARYNTGGTYTPPTAYALAPTSGLAQVLAGVTQTAIASIDGTKAVSAVQTLDGVTQTATASAPLAGRTAVAAQTTAAVSQTATLAARAQAAASQTLAPVAQAGTLGALARASSTQTLDGVTQLSTAIHAGNPATAAQTLAPVTQTATLSSPAQASAAQTLAGVTQVATAVAQPISGVAAAQQLAGVSQTATALARVQVAAAQQLASVIQTAAATVLARLTAAQVLDPVSQLAQSFRRRDAAAAQQLDNVTQAATLAMRQSIVAAQTLAGISQTATALAPYGFSATQVLAGVTQVAMGRVVSGLRAEQVLAGVVQLAIVQHEYVFQNSPRTYVVRAENRTFVVPAEARTFVVKPENRSFIVRPEDRNNILE